MDLFDEAERVGDGGVTQNALIRALEDQPSHVLTHLGLSNRSRIQTLFRALDTDGDAFISR